MYLLKRSSPALSVTPGLSNSERPTILYAQSSSQLCPSKSGKPQGKCASRSWKNLCLVLSLVAPLAMLAVGCGGSSSGVKAAVSAGSPTAGSPTTGSPTTGSPTTGSPTTGSPTTGSPTTGSPTTGSAASVVPANAVVVSSIQALGNWQENHDPATGATSSGSMYTVSSPSLSGNAREFDTSFNGSGGEIYHISFGSDTTSTNFFYDAEVYLTSSASNIANLEMDMNQVTANGETVIYGFQCDGYSGTWDYTKNSGSPSSPNDSWVHSGAACNVRKWSQDTWHHIQISYSRDGSGNVTYHSVWLDGVESKINATVPSAFALGWSSTLLTNFQIDGLGSGSDVVYLDKLTISRW
jgi:hypothetical protein